MTTEEKVAQLLCPMGWIYDEKADSTGVGMLWATFRADPWTGRTLQNGLRPSTAVRRANELQRNAVEHTRLGIPLLLAEESPHGHMAIGATTFPTGLGLGATFSTDLMERMGRAMLSELNAQGAHIGFGPVLDLCLDPRWSRTEETMGEDPILVGRLGAAIVRGMQGRCTLKHLAAYGMGEGGQNGAAIQMGQRELVQTHLLPFRMAIEAGALSVMTAYNAIDGVPSTCNPWLLRDILRKEWGFRCLVISDLYSINVIHNTLHAAPSLEEATCQALRAGVDVDLGASAYNELGSKKEEGGIDIGLLDEAVRRILRLKFELGLFDHPYMDESKADEVHCTEHIELAKDIARASITLLKNSPLHLPNKVEGKPLLPLSKKQRIAVVGPNADDVYAQLGDYTAPQEEGKIVTIKEGLRRKGFQLVTTEEADVIVAVVGGSSSRYSSPQSPHKEGSGSALDYLDTGAALPLMGELEGAESGEGLDRCSLYLLGGQQEMLQALKQTGKPLVVIYVEGRPLLKNWTAEHADALLTAYYPGEQGGTAVADVLCGDYNPAGRLPVSVPRSIGQLPVYYNRPLPQPHDYVEGTAAPLYPFGYGLSYTTFRYSDLNVCRDSVSFIITNTGERDGEEVPQLYIRDDVASVVLPERQLRHFTRIFIPKGESRRVCFHLTDKDFSLIDSNLKETMEPGTFTLMVGASSSDIKLSKQLRIEELKDLRIVEASDGDYQWPDDTLVVRKLHQWQDQKFGILIHWGLYSVPGIVESWSICDEDWIRRDTTMTYEEYKRWYWGLAEEFRPTRFDPDQWARIAQEAGMKYMLFTTKHHDGFCLFDSRETNFNVARYTGRDLLEPVLTAFRKRGLMTGTYFSKPDWHSQLYWWDVYPIKRGRNVNYPVTKYPERWKGFQQFTYRQIEELMSRYGALDILWLDGGWVCKENQQDIDMPHIAEMARRHQPGLIIVDRTIRGPYENYQTPERTIPETQQCYPWESCIPLSDDWGWVPYPRWKSAQQVINTLIEVVAKGGNLVLGIGPTAEGLIQPEAEQCLQEIGLWLQKNGRAIYGTTTTPNYHEGNLWFTASKNGPTHYALLAQPEGEPMPTTLAWHGQSPRKGCAVRLLATGKKLEWAVRDGITTVRLPKDIPNQPLAIVFETNDMPNGNR